MMNTVNLYPDNDKCYIYYKILKDVAKPLYGIVKLRFFLDKKIKPTALP